LTIFRGPGGGGNATSDSALNALTALTNDASNSATVAGASATAAGVSEGNAASSAAAAASSASGSSTSATTATTQASNASTSASGASTSASNASTSASEALASQNAAAASQATASTAATTATTQAGIATTQATNAASSASTASTQATNAASSASDASTSAANASNSATAASGSASTASTQASNASSSASAASTSASNASTSASNASNSATEAANTVASKANIASPTFTGTVGGVTAAMVGLGAVNNTSDASKPVSTNQLSALNLKTDVSALSASSGASLVGYLPAGTGAVARTAQNKLRESVSVTDFGAASAADPTATTAALALAVSAVVALGGGDVIFPAGDFRINGILTLPGKVRLVGQGAGRVDQPVQVAATTLSWYGGATEMVRVGYQGATVVNGGIEGIRLDGRALATRGLSMKDIQHATVNDIVITGTTVSALYMTNTPAYAPTGFCVFKKIQISLRGGATNNAHGILLDGGGSGVDGVTLCSWSDIRVEHANGDGVRVNERGDGMTWYNYYSFRAGVETGFGIRAAGSSSGVIGSWALYNALPNGGIQIDSPGSALGWKFDTLNDIDMDPSAIDMIYGNGAFDVSVQTSISTRQLGPAKIRGFRNSIIEDGMHFRRWDSGNNSLITNKGNYLTGGAYAGSNITSASQPGGAVSFSTGNVATNALYFSACGLANSGYASVYIPQMAVTWTPTSTTLFVARAGFVGSFADLPSDGIYVEAAPGTSGAYRCVTRLGGVETATVTPVGLGIAVVQWRIEYKPGVALFFYRTPGNNQWGLGAAHTTNIPTVFLADVVYIRTLEASGKGLSIYDYKIAWNLEQ
jgi:hypothetical protein